MAQVGNLIVVGTYEEFVLGYAIVPDELNEKKLSLVQTFACHSHKASVRSLAVGGIHLASGSTDETVQLYDLLHQVECGLLTHHEGTVNALAFTSDGTHLISGGADGTIAVVRTGSWFIEKKWAGTHSGSAVTGISVHPSGKLALSIGADNRLVTWNLVKGRKAYVTNLSSRCRNGWGVGDVQWSPSGFSYAVFMSSHVEIYSVETAGVSHTVTCSSRVTAISFINEDTILIGEDNGEAAIYKLTPPSKKGEEGVKEEIARFQAHDHRVKCAQYLGPVEDAARSAHFFVTAGGSGCICLWEFEGSEIRKVCETSTGCRLTCMIVVDLSKELKIKREQHAAVTKAITMNNGGPVESDADKKLLSKSQNGTRKRKQSNSDKMAVLKNKEETPSPKKVKHKLFQSMDKRRRKSKRAHSTTGGKWIVTPIE